MVASIQGTRRRSLALVLRQAGSGSMAYATLHALEARVGIAPPPQGIFQRLMFFALPYLEKHIL